MPDNAKLCEELKQLVVECLCLDWVTPNSIANDTLLFGEGLGLDSVDALEIVVALEQRYDIVINSHEVDKAVFTSIQTLVAFVESARAGSLGAERTEGTKTS